MYRTVYELTDEEIEELKETYYYQLVDTGEDEELGIDSSDGIPDELIYEHYDGISFVEDDFFCNAT